MFPQRDYSADEEFCKLLVRDIDALPGCARELIEQIQAARTP